MAAPRCLLRRCILEVKWGESPARKRQPGETPGNSFMDSDRAGIPHWESNRVIVCLDCGRHASLRELENHRSTKAVKARAGDLPGLGGLGSLARAFKPTDWQHLCRASSDPARGSRGRKAK